MATNFPTSYDDSSTLGPTFINVATPADPARNIDATFRNNLNETVIAIENRLGFIGETTTTTVDWALLTVGGTPNQGLRFAGASAQWPGAVGEDGIFIATGTGNVSFHKGGDPIGTFVDLTTGAGATWDSIYAADKDLAVNSADLDFIISGGFAFNIVTDDTRYFVRSDESTNTVILGDSVTACDVQLQGDVTADISMTGSRTISAAGGLTVDATTLDLNLAARSSGNIPLNEVGQLTPSTTATSIIGAINEIDSNSLQDAYDNGQIINVTSGDLEITIPAAATFYDFVVRDNSGGTPLDYIRADGSAGQLILGDLAGTGADLVFEGQLVSDITFNKASPTITTTSNQSLLLVPNGTGITQIGDAGATSHTLNTNDDLFVSGRLEVDGAAFFDGDVTVAGAFSATLSLPDDSPLTLGTGSDATLRWGVAAQTADTLLLGLGDTSRSLIIAENADINTDFSHPAQSKPTIFLHSVLDPSIDNGEHLSIAYNNITAGTMETDRATYSLFIKAATAFGAAVTNVTGGKLILEGGDGVAATDGGIVQVGAAFSTSRSLNSENDLGVLGDLEVDGDLYADGTLYVNINLVHGADSGSSTYWLGGTSGLASQLISSNANLHVGAFVGSAHGRALLLADRTHSTKNFDHGTFTDPFFGVHSALDPNTDHGEFLGIQYTGILAGTMETDRATYDVTVKASNAFASAVTNVTGGKLILEGGTGVTSTDGGIVQVGTGFSTSHSLDSENDLGIQGELEVNGNAWFDSNIELGTNDILGFGPVATAPTIRNHASNGFIFGLPATKWLIIADTADATSDFGHTGQGNPTIYLHSALNPDTDDGEFLAVTYNSLLGGTMETDRLPYNLTVKASNAFASATGSNRNGGDLVFEGGTGQAATFDGIVKVGTSFSTNHSLDAKEDFGIAGELEVDGIAWFDGDVRITQTSTTGIGIDVVRNLAAASTDSPVMRVWQDNASDDQAALQLVNDQSSATGGAALLLTTGVVTAGDGISAAIKFSATKEVTTVIPMTEAESHWTSGNPDFTFSGALNAGVTTGATAWVARAAALQGLYLQWPLRVPHRATITEVKAYCNHGTGTWPSAGDRPLLALVSKAQQVGSTGTVQASQESTLGAFGSESLTITTSQAVDRTADMWYVIYRSAETGQTGSPAVYDLEVTYTITDVGATVNR